MTPVTLEDCERIRDRLAGQAFLHEDPRAYEAGAADAIDAVEAVAADGSADAAERSA